MPAPTETFEMTKTPEEWRKILSPEQFHILREHGTERAGSSPLNAEKRPGIFSCAGCALPPVEACARVQKVPLLAGSITVDPPVGVDTTQPWSLRLRFAPGLDGGAPAGFLAQGASGPITEVRTAWTDAGVVETFNRPWPSNAPAMTPDQWHLLEHTFEPDAGRFSVRLDGQPVQLVAPVFPPRVGRLNKHLGAITVGGGGLNALDVWVGEISISQP